MKISMFTPTHKLDLLDRLYNSIKKQTYSNWEWVIILNNGPKIGQISEEIAKDERVKIYECNDSSNIGFLKRYAAGKCTGEVVMELDHDDELFPNALEECANAYQEDPSIDFVYSNCCDVRENYEPRYFGVEWGWINRPAKYKNLDLIETVSFEPDPRSLSKIWYAPNHFRSWKKSFYDLIGGHDPKLDVLDDQDIMCRTYISGKMKHIDKPLYVYHIHSGNTCYGEKNAKIQEMTLVLHDKYIYPMAEKWADVNNLRKIDLCGGFSKPAGYESIDLAGADITWNLNEKWPFADNSVGVLRAHDALEHLKDPIHVMKEAYRCLAPNGWFLTQTPSTDGRGAFQDPTHISFWNSNSFWYYTKAEQAKYIGTPVRFQLNRIKNFYPSDWHQFHNILYVKADLLKFSGRTPGGIEI